MYLSCASWQNDGILFSMMQGANSGSGRLFMKIICMVFGSILERPIKRVSKSNTQGYVKEQTQLLSTNFNSHAFNRTSRGRWLAFDISGANDSAQDSRVRI